MIIIIRYFRHCFHQLKCCPWCYRSLSVVAGGLALVPIEICSFNSAITISFFALCKLQNHCQGLGFPQQFPGPCSYLLSSPQPRSEKLPSSWFWWELTPFRLLEVPRGSKTNKRPLFFPAATNILQRRWQPSPICPFSRWSESIQEATAK